MASNAFRILIVALACTAARAEDLPAPAPQVAVGDCWKYRARNMHNRGPVEEFEECITFIDPAKKLIFTVATVNPGGREIDTTYTTEWAPRSSISGLISDPVDKSQPARFPLKPGDAYTEEIEFRRVLLGDVEGRALLRYRVTGWEEVSVPAGKFRALKIDVNGTSFFGQGRSIDTRFEAWYVPSLNRYAKTSFQSPALESGTELIEYRPKK